MAHFRVIPILLISFAAPIASSQATGRPKAPSADSLPDSNKPAVIKDLNVFLPQYPLSHVPSCTDKLKQAACQARVQLVGTWQQANADLQAGKTLLQVRDYPDAKQRCISALQSGMNASLLAGESTDLPTTAKFEAFRTAASDCVSEAELNQDEIDKGNLERLVESMVALLRNGDLEKAKALQEELRKRYTELPASSTTARSYAEIKLRHSDDWNWSVVKAWLPQLRLLLIQILIVLAGVLWFYVLLRVYRGARSFFRRISLKSKIKWFVQSIKDDEKQSGAGPVMDALSIEGNALLREPFRPPALLLIPPGFGGPQGGGVWWDFFGRPRQSFAIEWLPRAEINRHEFVLDEAFEEISVKIAGQELSGIVSLSKNISRWFNKGTPTVQGAILKVAQRAGNLSWAVRLTATSGYRWLTWVGGSSRNLTISVYSSTEEQEFVDAIGLAAQRAAFKLFYRLADPDRDPDEITAIAAFHQGVVLLRRYL